MENELQLINKIKDLLLPCDNKEFSLEDLVVIYRALLINDLNNVRCIIQSLLRKFKYALILQDIIPRETIEFREIIDMRFLSASGIEGVVFLLFQKGNDKAFAIGKYSKDIIKKSKQILKEISVGLLLNTIYEEVQNFMYCYGGFQCSVQKKDISKICLLSADENLTNIGLFEYIQDSNSLGSIINQIHFKNLLIIILQVINALSIANKRLNFSHGDLHLENILIQSLNEEKIIKIKQTFVSTYLIPKIIDYGYSSFYLNEEIKSMKNLLKGSY